MSDKSVYNTPLWFADKNLELEIINNGKSVLYNSSEYSLDELYKLGVTNYPTKPILSYNGECLILFDENTNLYFDRRQNHNIWSSENPQPYYDGTPFIMDSTLNSDIPTVIPVNIREILINHTSYIDVNQLTQENLFYDGTIVTDNLNLTINVINIDISN